MGDLRSACYSPHFKKVIGIAMINEPFCKISETGKLEIEGKTFMVAPRGDSSGTSCPNPRFCLSLGSLWPSFWLPLAAFGRPFGAFWHPLASSGLPWSCLWLSQAPHRQRGRNFAEILPRCCRERAENPLRTRQERAVQTPSQKIAGIPSQDLLQKIGQHSVTGLAAKN